jgi:hypothetical protein
VATFVLPDSLFGIGQRIFLAAAIGWMLTLCVFATRTARDQHMGRHGSAVFSVGTRSDAAAAPKL